YSVRKRELPTLINNAMRLTNEFISTLNSLLITPSDTNIETEFIKTVLTKNEETSKYTMSVITDIESNTTLNKNIFGDNLFSLAVSFGNYLFNKHDLFVDKNLENYFFSTLRKKNDLIVNTLKNLSKKVQ